MSTASTSIALDRSLADRISDLFEQGRKNILEIAAVAAEIRAAHFDERSRAYSSSFNKFWKDFDLSAKFGNLSNYTKYARAHGGVERARRCGATEEVLPGSLKALYAMSQLDDNELKLCLEDTWSRSEVTDDRSLWSRIESEPKPLIQPGVTESQINSWRNEWRKPSAQSEKKHGVTVAEVRIDSALLETKDAAATQKARDLINAIRDLKARFDDDTIELKINDKVIQKLGSDITGTKEDRRLARKIDASFERALTNPKEYVDPRDHYVACKLFGNATIKDVPKKRPTNKDKKRGRTLETVMVSPTLDEFRKHVGKEYLEKYGARRFWSTVARCQGQGHWAYKERREITKNGNTRFVMVNPLAEELIRQKEMLPFLLNQHNSSFRSSSTKETVSARIEELQLVISPKFDAMTDEKLLVLAREWCGLGEIKLLTYQKAPAPSETHEKAEAA